MARAKSTDININVSGGTSTGDDAVLQHTIDPDYSLPTLGTRAGVLKALRAIGDATIHRMIDPKVCTALAYMLQTALSVHNAKPSPKRKKSAQTKRAKK